jgi:nucleoside-diphosphate-sugar epimerase
MKVFVVGATGALGRRLLPALAEREHDVVALARGEAKASLVRSLGGTPIGASLFDADALAAAAEGADVVIHAATAIPQGKAARSRKGWAMNDRIRVEGTRALADAAGRVGARRFLLQSIVMVVGGQGDEVRDESWPPDPPELGRSAVAAERVVGEAGAARGYEVGVLRGGMFYGPDTADSRGMAGALRAGTLPIPGKGDRPLNPIRVEDMARAFALAVNAEASGTWHIVDDEPVPLARFLATFAAAVGGPEPRHVPRLAARAALGRHVLEAMTTAPRSGNGKARAELGWAPSFPTYREGIRQMVQAWDAETAG